jgi:hypothetical protein
MNVKQKLKKKRKKAWKQKINKTRALAVKLKFRLIEEKAFVPGKVAGYFHYNSFTGKMNAIYYLLENKLGIVMEAHLPEIEDYLDRLWKLKVFF